MNGIMAFRHNFGSQYQLAWFGRDGHPQGTVGDPGDMAGPRISPDQKTIAFTRTNEQNPDIWTFDLMRNTSSRFTFEPGSDSWPVWSPDSKSILYISNRNRSYFIVERPANGVGSEVIVASKAGDVWAPTGESHDGHWMVFTEASPVHSVIVLRSRDDPNKIIRIQGRENELDGSISPDGRWLLYSSAPASRREIIVQSMPQEAGGGRRQRGRQVADFHRRRQPAHVALGRQGNFLRCARWHDDGGARRVRRGFIPSRHT